MELKPLPYSAPVEQYQRQAGDLLQAHRSGDSEVIRVFHENHPAFLDSKIPWLPKRVPDAEIQGAALDLADAQLAIARWYSFESWPALSQYAEAVTLDGSPVFEFESAVEAVITGDTGELERGLRKNRELVHARSTRINHFDPPSHRATLLHYVAANGVEGYRQKSPKNAVAVAKILLDAGAEVDALANMYGEQCTTMSMLVSSGHPAKAGVQVGLVETLLDFGAAVDGAVEAGKWRSPLMTALVFGYQDAAEALVRRGARVDDIALAAGLGQLEASRQLLATADGPSRHRALALAAQNGHADIVRMLLDAGEDLNQYNPEGTHTHCTPLHQAVAGGHDAVVRLLVERGARLDIKDTIYQGTPLGWAMHTGKTRIENYLRLNGAKTSDELEG